MEVVREGQGTVWLLGKLPAVPGLHRGDVALNRQKVVGMILMPECANLSNDEWDESDEIPHRNGAHWRRCIFLAFRQGRVDIAHWRGIPAGACGW